MTSIRLYLNRIPIGLRAINLYKNWFKIIISYLGFGNKIMAAYLRDGTRYIVRKNMQDIRVISDIYMNKPYSRFLPVLREGGTVIDIGANIGVFSILAAKQNKSVKVYAYEPFKDNYSILIKNASINNLPNQINSFQMGVADKKGTRKLFIDSENSGGHTMYGNGEEISIKVCTLNDIFDKNKITSCDFLKIDCEGAEFEILYSTPQSVFNKIKTISLEFHEHEKDTAEELSAFLQKKGFETIVKGHGLGFIYAFNKRYIK